MGPSSSLQNSRPPMLEPSRHGLTGSASILSSSNETPIPTPFEISRSSLVDCGDDQACHRQSSSEDEGVSSGSYLNCSAGVRIDRRLNNVNAFPIVHGEMWSPPLGQMRSMVNSLTPPHSYQYSLSARIDDSVPSLSSSAPPPPEILLHRLLLHVGRTLPQDVRSAGVLSSLPHTMASNPFNLQRRSKTSTPVVSCSVSAPRRVARTGLPPPLHRGQGNGSMTVSTSEASSVLDAFFIDLTVKLTRLRYRLGVTRPLLLSLGHTSAVFALFALFMKDILYLRTFLVCGSLLGICFNLLRPQPLYLPAGWGLVFIIANIIQICILLHERREVEFKSEESEVYDMLFQRHGVTNHQFEKLLRQAQAEWVDLSAGDVILAEGERIDKICLILSGGAEVLVNGDTVGDMVRGFLIGESALLNKDHMATATVVAKGSMRILRLNTNRLWALLSADEHLSHSFAKAVSSDLAAKLLHNYKEMRTHNYSFETYKHLEALAAVGWTMDEFDDGAKHDRNHGHSSSVQAIWRLNEQLRHGLTKATRWAHFSRAPQSPGDHSEPDPALRLDTRGLEAEQKGKALFKAAAALGTSPRHHADTNETNSARVDGVSGLHVAAQARGEAVTAAVQRPEAAALLRGQVPPAETNQQGQADVNAKTSETSSSSQPLSMPSDAFRYACLAGI
ncbi:hypothetical protein CBR_g21134 [Chara braunii]|uniref:Cyclic nucleotide-binding domain-containing protein n=1 Tax=Chara braunii TaxID=69332 RepID=A0A388L0X9_CHABU|nr:hypothetical protein CBR_g21134 [Chara braunii]|eukprot:GBG75892.1 hypothetical protein CBR_g21134 [Chara braunii]